MIFKILTTNEDGHTIYARIDDDGKCRLTCTADYPELGTLLTLSKIRETTDNKLSLRDNKKTYHYTISPRNNR